MSTIPGLKRLTRVTAVIWLVVALGWRANGQELWYDTDVIALPTPEPPEFVLIEPLYDGLDSNAASGDAADPLNLGGNMGLLTQAERAPFRLFTHYAPRESVRGSSESLAANTVGGQLALPLRIYSNGIWLATSSFRTTELSTTASLPISGTPIPERLWDIRTGMFFNRTLINGWTVGGLFNFGSASDAPYHSVDELTFTTIGFVNVPARGRDTWDFNFFYSPTSPFAYPIPGVAYHWRPNDQFSTQIGLPASIVYSPSESFVFRARYTPLTDVLVEARQAIDRDWGLFARYQVTNDNYFLRDRVDRRLLFTQFEQQLVAGLTFNFENGFSVDLSAGYLFDRRLMFDTGFDFRSLDQIKIESGAILSAQLIWNL